MNQGLTFRSKTSSSFTCYTLESKSDIIAFAFGNPTNKSNAKLSKDNEDFFGNDTAGLFTKRHNLELRRCSQFYSLASVFDETITKDKHSFHRKNMKKIFSTGRKHLLRLFICF